MNRGDNNIHFYEYDGRLVLGWQTAPVVTLTAFVHLLNNLFKLVALWRDVHWPVSLKFGIPALLATIPGAWLLTGLSELPEMARYQIFGQEAG